MRWVELAGLIESGRFREAFAAVRELRSGTDDEAVRAQSLAWETLLWCEVGAPWRADDLAREATDLRRKAARAGAPPGRPVYRRQGSQLDRRFHWASFASARLREEYGDVDGAANGYAEALGDSDDSSDEGPSRLWVCARSLACVTRGGLHSYEESPEDVLERGERALCSTACNPIDVSTFRRWHALYLLRQGSLEGADEVLAMAQRVASDSPRQSVLNTFASAHLYLDSDELDLAQERFCEAAADALRLDLGHALRAALEALGPRLNP